MPVLRQGDAGAFGRACRQGTGQAVNAGSVGANRRAGAEGHRHRRDCDPQGALYRIVVCDLIRPGRSGWAARIARKPTWCISTTGWARGAARHSAGGAGHVETVSQCHFPAGAADRKGDRRLAFLMPHSCSISWITAARFHSANAIFSCSGRLSQMIGRMAASCSSLKLRPLPAFLPCRA